jgi:hypothetical protein
MPYIDPERRREIDLEDSYPENIGELNYFLTNACLDFLDIDPTYEEYNQIIGVLEAVKLEFYRRMVAPYEEKKLEENGDVY